MLKIHHFKVPTILSYLGDVNNQETLDLIDLSTKNAKRDFKSKSFKSKNLGKDRLQNVEIKTTEKVEYRYVESKVNKEIIEKIKQDLEKSLRVVFIKPTKKLDWFGEKNLNIQFKIFFEKPLLYQYLN